VQAQHTDLPIAEDLDVLDLVGDVALTPDLAKRLEEAAPDAKLSFEVRPNGRLKLNVDRLGALGDGESLNWLRRTTSKILPRIDLPDQLFEVESWTGFLDAFVQLPDLGALHRASVLTAEGTRSIVNSLAPIPAFRHGSGLSRSGTLSETMPLRVATAVIGSSQRAAAYGRYDFAMDPVAWPFALVGLPLWLAPPLLLTTVVTRARVVRIGFGTGLVGALTLLYLFACQLLQGPGLPIWIEALLLWGPTALAVCGAAVLTDRWLLRRRDSGDVVAAPAARRTMGPLLVAAFIVWSTCCGGCVVSPAAELMDLRFDSPTPGLVLPMPKDLTLVSADRECGSVWCSEIYLIGSPDKAGETELMDRLWAHLTGTKGWERMRDDAGCQRPGWFLRNEFCLFVDAQQPGPGAVLKIHVTGALTVQ